MLTRISALFLALFLCGHAAAEPDCSYDADVLMSLSPEAFNDDLDRTGWRKLADREECVAVAADLLKTYRLRLDSERGSILHHEAQLRAALGQADVAITLLQDLLQTTEDESTRAYHKAEIAFLLQDRDALVAARDKLLAVPKPEGFDQAVENFKQKYPDYPPPVWPTNLNVIDGFIACFDKPYSEAYSQACRPVAAE